MKRLDHEVWNRRTMLAIFVECIITLNIDVYGSSYLLWLQLHGLSSFIGMTATAVIIATFCSGIVSGVLIDRFGTKKVQLYTFLVILVTGLVGCTINASGYQFLVIQTVQFFAYGIVIAANWVQIRGLLPEAKQASGIGKLGAIGLLGSVVGVSTGSWLVSEHLAVWNWTGPIITALGIAALLRTKQSNHVPERTAILPHKGVLFLVVPSFGLAICQGVLVTFIVLDLGVKYGSLFRACMYIGSGVAGWVVPSLTKRLSEKQFIRLGVLFMSGAMLLIYQSSLIGLVVAPLVFGIVYNGVYNQILGTKAFVITDQKGRAASTSSLVTGLGRIAGVNALGAVRDQWGMAVWLTLPFVLIIFLPLFELTFRRSSAWKRGSS